MKRYVLFAVAAVSLVACERRDGKIIIDEQKTKETLEESGEKTLEGAKKLGKKVDEAAKKAGDKVEQKADELDREHKTEAPKGQGGGPTAKDAGVDAK